MTAAALPTSVRRGLAFLAGIGFAAVPTVGPYLALLGVATGRVQLRRSDAWWWLAAALWGLPWLVAGYGWASVGATGQALAIWLIFRSAAAIRAATAGTPFPRDLGAGLLVGLAGAMALGLERAGEWRLDTARSVFDLVAWTGNPALFAHAMLVLSALLAVILPSPRGRALALGLGAVAVLVSGAQEAVLAWLVVAIGMRFVGRRGTRGTAIAEWALVGLMVLVASGATASLGTGRTGYRIALVTDPTANLLRGTETSSGDWWYELGVRFDATTSTVASEARTVYSVTKIRPRAVVAAATDRPAGDRRRLRGVGGAPCRRDGPTRHRRMGAFGRGGDRRHADRARRAVRLDRGRRRRDRRPRRCRPGRGRRLAARPRGVPVRGRAAADLVRRARARSSCGHGCHDGVRRVPADRRLRSAPVRTASTRARTRRRAGHAVPDLGAGARPNRAAPVVGLGTERLRARGRGGRSERNRAAAGRRPRPLAVPRHRGGTRVGWLDGAAAARRKHVRARRPAARPGHGCGVARRARARPVRHDVRQRRHRLPARRGLGVARGRPPPPRGGRDRTNERLHRALRARGRRRGGRPRRAPRRGMGVASGGRRDAALRRLVHFASATRRSSGPRRPGRPASTPGTARRSTRRWPAACAAPPSRRWPSRC